MRNAERGASQIPLVICIVLLLATGFMAYTYYGDRDTLQQRLTRIQEQAKAKDQPGMPSDSQIVDHIKFALGPGAAYKERLDRVGELVGSKDEVNLDLVVDPAKLQNVITHVLEGLDKKDYTIEFPVDRYVEDPAQGVIKVQEGAGKIVVSYGGSRDLRGAKPDLTNVLEFVVHPAMNRMAFDIKRHRDMYIQAVNAKETAEAAYRKDLEAKDGEIKAKVEEQAALEARKNQEVTDLRRQLSEAEAAKAASEEEKNKAVAALTAERNSLKSEAEKRLAEVQVLKQRKRAVEEDTSPDGSVLSVSDSQDFVVVDTGRNKNNLLAGTNFDVYAIGKSGQEIPKGVIKVTKVDASSSSCAVLSLYSKFDPIVPGDKIRSLTYSPKETIHVALVGRFQKMGKSDAARRLQSLGVVVDEQVTVNTTYLVVGEKETEAQPIEETSEFKTADLYGIPKISERELSRFTMY